MNKIFAFFLVLVFISAMPQAANAEIGQMRTKRERMLLEKRNNPNKEMGDAYLKIHENFLRENYSEVVRLADSYLSDGLTRPNSEDVLYLQALSLLKLNRGAEARVKLKELESVFTQTDRKASASASIGDSYFYEGNYSQAYSSYEETLRNYPNSDQTTYAQFKLKELSVKLSRPYNPSPFSLKQASLEETPFFTVQVGSFSKVRNANAVMNKLIHRRYDAYIDHEAQGGLYRVRVGHLSGRNEASQLELRLKREGYPTKIYP